MGWNMVFEDCPFCGKDGLKRENGSLYELNGWLHICKTTPAHRSINYYSCEQLATNYDFDNGIEFLDLREVNYVSTTHYND